MYVNDRLCDLGAKIGEDTETFSAPKAHKNSTCQYLGLELGRTQRLKPAVRLQAGLLA